MILKVVSCKVVCVISFGFSEIIRVDKCIQCSWRNTAIPLNFNPNTSPILNSNHNKYGSTAIILQRYCLHWPLCVTMLHIVTEFFCKCECPNTKSLRSAHDLQKTFICIFAVDSGWQSRWPTKSRYSSLFNTWVPAVAVIGSLVELQTKCHRGEGRCLHMHQFQP